MEEDQPVVTAEHVRQAVQVIALQDAARILRERQRPKTFWQRMLGETATDIAIRVLEREADR